MPENMMVGSHKGQNKNWDEGYERTFGKKRVKTPIEYCECLLEAPVKRVIRVVDGIGYGAHADCGKVIPKNAKWKIQQKSDKTGKKCNMHFCTSEDFPSGICLGKNKGKCTGGDCDKQEGTL